MRRSSCGLVSRSRCQITCELQTALTFSSDLSRTAVRNLLAAGLLERDQQEDNPDCGAEVRERVQAADRAEDAYPQAVGSPCIPVCRVNELGGRAHRCRSGVDPSAEQWVDGAAVDRKSV